MAPPSDGTVAPGGITRDDLQRKFQAFQDGILSKVEARTNTILTVAGVAGVVVILFVFLLGRRSGKKKTTIVEVRRF